MITINEALNYLRIDAADQTTKDEVQGMLDAAKELVQRKTGYVWEETSKTYDASQDRSFIIYDYPINTDLEALENDYTSGPGYTRIENPLNADTITLNVGYQLGGPPRALEQATLQLLKHYYYESETGAVSAALPPATQQIINQYRRFIV